MMAFRTLRSKCALLAPVCLLVLGAARMAAADTINLGWDPSGSSVGYKVHVGVQSGSYTQHFDVGQSTTFAFTSATAGQRYCFAVSAYTLSSQVEGPNSGEVCGYSNAPPTLVNPGNRTSTVGQATSLQLQGSDPESQPLTYSASGLPAGLTVMASTGYISGTGTTAGTYSVTARASDGTLSTSQTFTWTVSSSTGGGGTTPPPTGSDTTRPVVTIAAPTSSSTYAVNASSLAMSGTASDNVAVTQVRWENDQMNLSGVANGLTNWTTNVPLQVGSNTLYITAIDAAGNEGVDILTVSVSTTGGTTDTTAPTISIGTPTTGSTYSTTQSTVNLTGSASDNRGVSQVTWTNSAGGSGVASGTTSWSIANLPLQAGTNMITVTSVDAAGNRGTDTLSVTRSSTTTSDTTAPAVSIAAPTTGSTYSTSQSTVNVSGSASDNRGVSQVTWTNSAGGSGVASGTTSWSIANIPLVAGTNVITVTAADAAGNRTTDTLTVTRSTTTSSGTVPTLRLDSGSQNGWFGVRLYWTQISWSSVDVYRNNVRLKNTANDGSTDDIFTTRGTYTYKVCAPGSTTVCSNSVTAYF